MKAKFDDLPVLSCIDAGSRDQLYQALVGAGNFVFEIAGKFESVAKLFQEMRAILPLDPPLSGSVKWAAFEDSLFGGLDQLRAENVAILLHDADAFAYAELTQLFVFVDCVLSVARLCGDPLSGITTLVKLRVILLGCGPGFVQYDGQQTPPGARL